MNITQSKLNNIDIVIKYRCFRYENIDSDIVFHKITEGEMTWRHDFMLVIEQRGLDVIKYSSSHKSMYGIHYLLIVCMVVGPKRKYF